MFYDRWAAPTLSHYLDLLGNLGPGRDFTYQNLLGCYDTHLRYPKTPFNTVPACEEISEDCLRDVAASSVGERILCTSSMIIYWIQGITDDPSAMSDRSTY